MTPLTITLADTPIGKAALGPVLNLTREQRAQLFDTIVAAYCPAAGALLVGDIGVSIASGTGFLTLTIGGVEAASADLIEGNPFGAVQPFELATPAPPAAATPVRAASPPAASTGSVAAARPAVSTGPLDAICRSVHPSHHPSCSRGVGVPLAVVGVVVTAGIGFLDWRRQRLAIPAATET